ncbi:MAG: cohesin domain-containing protein [bacterium]
MKLKVIYTLIGVYLLLLLWAPHPSAGMSSPSFWVPAQILDGGGSQNSSESFRHIGTVSQTTPIGFSNSGSFYNYAGFIPQISTSRQLPLSEECSEDGSWALDIEGIKGKVGSEVLIPIRIQSAPNAVTSLGFGVSYDAIVLEYTGFEKGDLVTAFTMVDVSSSGPGKVKVAGFDTGNGFSQGKNGYVLYLKFKVIGGQENECYPLQLETLKDHVANFSKTGGCFCISSPCNGDLNDDGEITPLDALTAFKCYLGTGPCSDCTDVNQDGEVTPLDALCLFKKFLGQSSCLD